MRDRLRGTRRLAHFVERGANPLDLLIDGLLPEVLPTVRTGDEVIKCVFPIRERLLRFFFNRGIFILTSPSGEQEDLRIQLGFADPDDVLKFLKGDIELNFNVIIRVY